jgi:hypothetical protein
MAAANLANAWFRFVVISAEEEAICDLSLL